jgi:hypothetical protein
VNRGLEKRSPRGAVRLPTRTGSGSEPCRRGFTSCLRPPAKSGSSGPGGWPPWSRRPATSSPNGVATSHASRTSGAYVTRSMRWSPQAVSHDRLPPTLSGRGDAMQSRGAQPTKLPMVHRVATEGQDRPPREDARGRPRPDGARRPGVGGCPEPAARRWQRGGPTRDRTGETYAGVQVLGVSYRVGTGWIWSCRCRHCGRAMTIESRHMAQYERHGHGCRCGHGVQRQGGTHE